MCGIAGWYRRGGRAVDAATIHAQCATIVHRGPDDEGVMVDADFGMGMRRLAVVDLSGGHQPMATADGRHAIVFNGEVYNFVALRAELQALGRHFHTRSDTEVVLEAFAAWGDAAWPRLEGMFAVALWDRLERTLRLVRDPLGIKPLYWTAQQGGLAFGSELKALGPVPGLAFEVDAQAVEQFVTLGAVLAPRSIYGGIFKLKPGTLLTLGEAGPPALQRFWSLRLRPQEGGSEQDWIAQCREKLLATVKSHLVADVPLGAFLSGGVDSSAVVAAMSQLTKEPVRTFTIGFAQPDFDETAIAAEAATHLGCHHRAGMLQPRAAVDILGQLATVYDEPFADDSAIPTWFVSRMAREDVTVALSGDGGDELFAGYRRHGAELQLQRLKRLPGASLALRGLARLPDGQRALARVRKLAHDGALSAPAQRSFSKQYRAPEDVLQALWGRAMSHQQVAGYRRWAEELLGDAALPGDPLQTLLYADTTIWLPDDMLVKVDRASMAHSLEVRVPLLAHGFVDWCATVPLSLKHRGNVGKYLLRRAIEDWLPKGLLDRPKKGFAVPISDWLQGEFGDRALEVWQDSGAETSGFFAPQAFARLLAEHRRGTADHAGIVYTLLMFAYWWPTRLGASASKVGTDGLSRAFSSAC